MNTDEKIRAALRMEPTESPARAGEWDAFERRARRARQRLVIGSIAMTLIVFGTSAALIRAFQSDREGFVQQSGGQWVDESAGYHVDVPAGWEAKGEPGRTAFFSPSQERREADGAGAEPRGNVVVSIEPLGPRFWPRVTAVDNAGELDVIRQRGIKISERAGTIGGHWGTRFDVEENLDACRDCPSSWIVLSWTRSRVLRIIIRPESQLALDTYKTNAFALIRSLSPSARDSGENWHGMVDIATPIDGTTRELMDFLEARVARLTSARAWVSPDAASDGLNWLYGNGAEDYTSWSVGGRTAIDENSWKYDVSMSYEGDCVAPVDEVITWAPGRNVDSDERPWLVKAVAPPELHGDIACPPGNPGPAPTPPDLADPSPSSEPEPDPRDL